MEEALLPDIRAFVGSVGILIDRSASPQEVLGTAWLLEKDRLATCAHVVSNYSGHLDALAVRFPAIKGEERGISSVIVHPRFDKKRNTKMLSTGATMVDGQPALSLQKHNAAVLTMGPLQPISDQRKADINKALTLPPPSGPGMSGNLSEIDLALIVQTVTNGRKEGTIVLSDGRYRPIASMFCRNGKVLYAKYRNLINEYALFQIFAHRLDGHFYFQSAREPDWAVDQQIARPTDMLLIEAHRRFDELQKLTSSLGGLNALYHRAVEHLDSGILPEDIRDSASQVWAFIDGATPAGMLSQLINLDDYAIFRALIELFKTRQIENASEGGAFLTGERELNLHIQQSKLEPLAVSELLQLAPLDALTSLTVDSTSGRPRARDGSLLGALREGDPWHLIHTVHLLPEAAGSPLFKDGCVVGMHCGNLPAAPKSTENEGRIQQMLWIESILECLKLGGEGDLAKKLSSKGEEKVRNSVSFSKLTRPIAATPEESGCFEAAKIACPKCGMGSLKSARFCKTCGQRLIADVETVVLGRRPGALAVVAVVLLLGLTVSACVFLARMPAKPNLVLSPKVILPDQPWLDLAVNKFDAAQYKWIPIRSSEMLKKADHIYISMRVHEPCHVYLLERPSTSDDISVIYPSGSIQDDRLEDGSKVAIPPDYEIKSADGQRTAINGLTFGGSAATDVIVAVACRDQLNLNSPVVVRAAFDAALPLLAHGDLPDGIEVDARSLGLSMLTPNAKDGSPSALLYLARLQVSHGDE